MNNCGIGFADYSEKCDYSSLFKSLPEGHTSIIHYSLR